MKIRLFILFLFIICLIPGAWATDYGLHMQTFPHHASEFTSLALEGGEPIRISGKKATLGFKIWNRPENVFGVIFRILTDQNCNIDLMYGVAEDDRRHPDLVVGNAVHCIPEELAMDSWIDVTLEIDPKNLKITLEYDGNRCEADAPQIKNTENLRIFFGSCNLAEFELNNIASVNIRDISLSLQDKPIREWNLCFHENDICYDNIEGRPATATNAIWLLDGHTIWRNVFKGTYTGSTSVAFDAESATMFITDNDNIICVGSDGTERRLVPESGRSAAVYPNSLIYIPEEKSLMSYNIDQDMYSCFDFDKCAWTNSVAPATPHKEYYWNNTAAWNQKDSTLISFGGYGHYQFNNTLVICNPNARSKVQRQEKIEEIDPRYCPASALVDSILYIFGGRGNPSGKQEMTQRYYYDLHACNLRTGGCSKVWEFAGRPADGDFMPGGNMLYNASEDCFYVFGQQDGCVLMKISRSRPEISAMSHPIDIENSAQYTYTTLYHSHETDKLFAVILQRFVNDINHVHLYELNFPAVVLKNEILEEGRPEAANKRSKAHICLVLAFAAVLAGAGAVMVLWRKRTASVPTGDITETPAAASTDVSETVLHTAADGKIEITRLGHYDFSHGSIRFFGGFSVKDKDGNDITDLFTPTLKALTILLVLYTGKDAMGISGHRLIQTLWFDKTEESAKNNRNVYMSKLRSILEKIGDVKVVNQKGFWRISFEGDAKCDYLEAQSLFKGHQDPEKLVELLLRGVMLPNTESDFVDPFKSDFSNTTIDFLTGLLQRSDLTDQFRLKIADTLFQHDFINEDALRTKVGIFYRQGKKGLAKTVYDTFCKEYQASLGTPFNVPMLDLVK